MTNKQRRALAAYVREVMDVVGLPHWKLILMRDQPEDTEEAGGFCSPVFGQHTARMWFAPDLFNELPTRQRYVVVHEVLHIPLQGPWEAWSEPLSKDGHLSRPVFDVITANAVREWEMCIDTLARGLAPFLPFIDWEANPAKDWIPKAKGVDEMHVYSRMWDKAGHHTPT